MPKRNFLGPLVLGLLCIVFAFGLYQIFSIRLVSGGLYPAWSSLRSDPDGTRVLFDSLAGTGRFETFRKFKPLKQSPERNATVLFLGYSPAALVKASNADLDGFEHAAQSGNRIVVALDPQSSGNGLVKRWGVSIGRGFFGNSGAWTTIAAVNGRPVVLERAFGSGSIVLSADSSVFANRALAAKRDAALLMRLIGPNTRVAFDESHLGVADTGSVLGLVHKYRLDGVLWGLLALAILFVWSHVAGFPPADSVVPQTITGYDSHAALAQLLRRQIP